MLRCRALGRKRGANNPICETTRDFLAGLIIFFTVFALAALDSNPARPQTAAASAARSAHAGQDQALTPDQMRSGALLTRGSGADASEHFSEALQLDTDVSITVDGPAARTTVTQTFRNDGDRPLEGLYVFPLPDEAAVDSLTMQIGANSVTSDVVSRSKARAMYADAALTGQRAAFGGGQSDNIFTSSVVKIAPGDTVIVRIEYQQTPRWSDGRYTLRFPLVTTPRLASKPMALGVRYDVGVAREEPPRSGQPETGVERHRDTPPPVSLQVKLQAGFPLGNIESVNHAAEVKRLGEDGALLTLHDERRRADKDFVLSWAPRAISEPAPRLFRQTYGKSEYLLAMLSPPAVDPSQPRRPREVVFVIDTSGSMAGSAILQAREALDAAVSRLAADDKFNIIAFDSAYEALFKAPVPADENGKAIAHQFIDRLIASGSTDMMRPLGAALQDASPDDTTRVRQVVLITDGSATKEQKLFSEIAVRRGRSRLFLIGIGPVSNPNMLRRAAEVGRGNYIHIRSTHDVRARMDQFLQRLERPAITDIKVEWPKGARADTLPDPIPDVYAGEPLVVSAQAGAALKGPVRISGIFRGKRWQSEIGAGALTKGSGIAKVWARWKIASLESHGYYARQDGGDISAQIEKVALEHGLVSRMTRLVAVEKAAPKASPEGLSLTGESPPASRPHGWVHNGTFDLGTETESEREASLPPGAGRNRVARVPEIASGIALSTSQEADRTAAEGGSRPRAQTPDKAVQIAQAGQNPLDSKPKEAAESAPVFTARMGVIAIMALVFAAMSALTLGLWRQFGRLHAADTEDKERGV